ncbi:MAG: acyltransferase [Candidatus Acidiferrum sp.]|jgi:peptidoglycan/LPS O-acetylase OafA/YrhL
MQPRIPELDGLRGFAILQVISIHYFYNPGANLPIGLHFLQSFFALGWTGVDLFFVLSGFLIGGILLDVRAPPNYFKTFYIRRFFRIVPLYYLWLFCLIGLVFVRGAAFQTQSAHPGIDWHLWGHFLFLQNLWTNHYSTLALWWLGVTWSLAIEEQFYLAAPLLVRFLSRRHLIIFLSVVILTAPCLRILVRILMHKPVHAMYRLTPFRADALALGMLAAILWRVPEFRAWLGQNKNILYAMFGLFLAGMFALGIWFQSPDSSLTQTVGYSWIALFYLSLLLIVLTDAAGLLARVARIGWLGGWGRISYCIYLIHAAVKYFCTNLISHSATQITQWRSGAAILLSVAITFGIANLSWAFFEAPLLQKGPRYKY